jgi:DNA-binding response OmpR family regulator
MDNELKSKSVLIVEDEKALSNAIDKKFRLNGLKTFLASSVNEAEKLLKKSGGVDVIWLDHYLLGSRDGLDFVRDIKAGTDHKDIPIYLVSNTASDDKVSSYIKIGVEKYYIKSNNRLDDIVGDVIDHINGKK